MQEDMPRSARFGAGFWFYAPYGLHRASKTKVFGRDNEMKKRQMRLNRLTRFAFSAGTALVFLISFASRAKAEDYLNLPVVKPVVSCDQLGSADLSKAVGKAVTVKSATVTDTPKGKFCKVTGTIAPAVNFEADLPMEHWTQRLAQGGCGAYCGNVRATIERAGTCMPALNGEFAVAGDDMGHQGAAGGPGAGPSATPDSIFGTDPDKRLDFAYRANHETTLVTKALIKIFYGQPQKFAYFLGCSDGGREALVEAQRYPNDFDGISAGAPVAIINVHNSFFHGWDAAVNKRADGSYILLRPRLSILHAAVLAHCPTLSGVQDGLLENPFGCKFDRAWVECPAGATDTSNCFTPEEAAVAQKLYQGPGDGQGHLFEISGFALGTEMSWNLPAAQRTNGSGGPGGGGGGGMTTNSIKYLLLPSVASDQDVSGFRYDQEWFHKVGEMGAPLYNAANTDLKPFESHGGKLIMWHGLADTSVPPVISVAYYQGVQKEMGDKTTDSFLRLFLVPGVGHCGGGDGFPQIDTLSPLMAWTELHRAPTEIIASKISNQPQTFGAPGGAGQGGQAPRAGAQAQGGPATAGRAQGPGGPGAPGGAQAQGGGDGWFSPKPYAEPDKPALASRPVYAYPYVARYTGKGDPKEAANYEPVKVPEKLPLVFETEATTLIGPDNQKFYRVEGDRLVADDKLAAESK